MVSRSVTEKPGSTWFRDSYWQADRMAACLAHEHDITLRMCAGGMPGAAEDRLDLAAHRYDNVRRRFQTTPQ